MTNSPVVQSLKTLNARLGQVSPVIFPGVPKSRTAFASNAGVRLNWLGWFIRWSQPVKTAGIQVSSDLFVEMLVTNTDRPSLFNAISNGTGSRDQSSGDVPGEKTWNAFVEKSEIRGKRESNCRDQSMRNSKWSKFKLKNTGRSCDPKLCWYQPSVESLPMDFCNNTSLHGLKYLGQTKRHLTERIFWLMAFLIGCFAAVYLISDVWRRYRDSPVIVSFEPEETNIDQIPFPAVTICNMNKVLRTKAMKYQDDSRQPYHNRTSDQNLYYLDHVCSSSKSFTKRFNLTSRGDLDVELKKTLADWQIEGTRNNRSYVSRFLIAASQPCEEMIRLCTWKDKVHDCDHIFRSIETDFGKCCTFNMVPQTLLHRKRTDDRDDPAELKLWNISNLEETWLHSGGKRKDLAEDDLRPRRQNQAGKSFGLSILLDPALNEYFCTTSDSTGFRLATHLSTENPHVIDYGIAVMPNSEMFIRLRPELTKADSTIHGYPLASRNCYFPYEFNLTYYEYYTASNCVDECIADTVFKECYCVRYYMPRGDNDRPLCGPGKFACVENVTRGLADIGLKRNCSHCLPSCTEITYFEETTTAPLQTDKNWKNSEESHSNRASANFSIVHIYFGQDSTYARIRKELYGTTDLFANTGGLMGLCLGFSGLSAMEVLYFLTLRAWCRKRRRRSLGAKVAAKFRDLWIKAKNTGKYRNGRPSTSTQKSFIKARHPTPTIVDQDFHGSSRLVFTKERHALSPNSRSERILKKTLSFVETPEENPLPIYSAFIREISPFYESRQHGDSEFN